MGHWHEQVTRFRTYAAALRPARLRAAIEHRGLCASVLHAARRLGTVMGRAITGPDVIQLSLLDYTCNHTCPMCSLQHLPSEHLRAMKRRDKAEGLRFAEYVALFNRLGRGLREVNLIGGGEPLLHRDALAVMREIKRRGWRGSLVTNGTLLDEAAAAAVVDMRWDYTRVSIHAGDRETYRLIQGVDRFEVMRRNLTTFDRLRRAAHAEGTCRLVACHVIQRENLDTMLSLFRLSEDVGADAIFLQLVIPRDDGMRLTDDEMRRAHEAVVAAAASSPLPCNLDEMLAQLAVPQVSGAGDSAPAADAAPWVPGKRCSVGFDQSFITAAGEVIPCCFSHEQMGRLGEASFDEIWTGRTYADFRARLIRGEFAPYCISNRCSLPGVIQK
jgi:MoaA/NifB/PqqE/SkfB family radical SAM enzyme